MSLSKSSDGDVVSWQFPEIDGSHSVNEQLHNIKIPTANELESIQRQAHDEALEKGYQEGLAKGLKAGEAKITQQAQGIRNLMNSLAEPLKELDEKVESELVDLAILIAKQLVRRELKIDSGQVVAVVKEAVAALPSSSHLVKLHLHPEDASLVRAALQLDEADGEHWKIIEDPVLTRGGCRVQTENSQIDATIENRLSSIIANLLGDERAGG